MRVLSAISADPKALPCNRAVWCDVSAGRRTTTDVDDVTLTTAVYHPSVHLQVQVRARGSDGSV